MKKLLIIFTCLMLMGAVSTQARAELIDYDYAGNITHHNDIMYFNFSMKDSGSVIFATSSWNVGGYDPILALWDSAGNLIREVDDASRPGSVSSNGVEYDYSIFDSVFTAALAAGDYTLTLVTYANRAQGNNLSDGFAYDSHNAILIENWAQPANGYRTSYYEVHIIGVQGASPTPEPGTVLLLGLGLGALLLVARRRGLGGRNGSMYANMA